MCPGEQAASHEYAALDNGAMDIEYLTEDLLAGEEQRKCLPRDEAREVVQLVQSRAVCCLEVRSRVCPEDAVGFGLRGLIGQRERLGWGSGHGSAPDTHSG